MPEQINAAASSLLDRPALHHGTSNHTPNVPIPTFLRTPTHGSQSGSSSASSSPSDQPAFVRCASVDSLSSIESDNDETDPRLFNITYQHSQAEAPSDTPDTRYINVYRGFCIAPHQDKDTALQYGCLSPYGRELTNKGSTSERALVDARKSARRIASQPDEMRKAVQSHQTNSSTPVFRVSKQSGGLGPSPFVSVSASKAKAAWFAMPRSYRTPPGSQPCILTFSIARSKAMANPANSTEQEMLVKGGLNPRHIVRVETPTVQELADTYKLARPHTRV